MSFLRKVWQRIFMFTFYKATYLMKWKVPELIEGENSILNICNKIKELNLDNAFVVIDSGIYELGLTNDFISSLDRNSIKYVLFTDFKPNPSIIDIEKGVELYNKTKSSFIIAIGGGSAIDTAKAIGARIARPNKSLEQLGGLLKVNKKIPTFFAVPTTAGTGSETTIASVVTNEETHHKYAINDLHLIPDYAYLDPMLTINLPKSITAMTGMDALTHAVEGYLSCDVPKKYRLLAEEAINTIISKLTYVYDNPHDIEARNDMLKASFKAGVVFTRVGLTYVHPIAHTLGGLYHVPHGLANAIVLPHCLRYYGSKVYKKLARLSDVSGLSKDNQTIEEKANLFINQIDIMNNHMNLSQKFEIKEEDIPKMIKWALKEANSAYYPPVILDYKDIENIIREIKA